jgi:hypothetical protein
VPDGVRVAALELDDLEQHPLERVENTSVELGPASRVMMVAKTPSLNAANRLVSRCAEGGSAAAFMPLTDPAPHHRVAVSSR